MNIKILFPNFSHLERDKFPEHHCVYKNTREPDVYDSSDDCYHLVVLVDNRFRCNIRILKMKPYIAITSKGEKLYGWVDSDGNYSDHGERDIHDDNSKVVAWSPCSPGFDLRKKVDNT